MTIAQELINVFGAADIKDSTPDGINLIDIVRHCDEEDGYDAAIIAAAQQIAAEYGWKMTVTRRGRWISIEGPRSQRVFTQDEINAARDAMSR